MYLGYAGFSDAQNLANFLHGKLFIVIEGDHQAFFFGEGVNGFRDNAFEFVQPVLRLRVGIPLPGQAVEKALMLSIQQQ